MGEMRTRSGSSVGLGHRTYEFGQTYQLPLLSSLKTEDDTCGSAGKRLKGIVHPDYMNFSLNELIITLINNGYPPVW